MEARPTTAKARFGNDVTVEMKYEEAWAVWALLQEIIHRGLGDLIDPQDDREQKMKDLSFAFEELSYTLGHRKERPSEITRWQKQ